MKYINSPIATLTPTPNLCMMSLTYENGTTLGDINTIIIKAYLNQYKHNISKVSRLLGISRQTIYNWKQRNEETLSDKLS